jgi:DNA-binding beta-propeller fold protein YncE
MAKRLLVVFASTPVALIGCHAASTPTSDDLPTEPPTKVTMVATGGFQAPTDAVASPDGKTLYFAAWDPNLVPTVFQVPSAPGSTPTVLAAGAPLEAPLGMVLSCDGNTLFVGDMGGDTGAIISVPAAGGAPTALATTGINRPSGMAMGPDCSSLFATGQLADGTPALFSLPLAGGAARVVYQGAPLVSPTGLYVDSQGVAWVLDHRAQGASGEGVLFSIPSSGSAATEIASALRMGTPGGVSLTAGGGNAVIPTRDADGAAQLTSVDVATGAQTQLAVPDMTDPTGLRTARKAGVFALVDSEGATIYRAE